MKKLIEDKKHIQNILLENDDFKDVYEKSKTFVPKKWISNNENLLKKIKEYIDND